MDVTLKNTDVTVRYSSASLVSPSLPDGVSTGKANEIDGEKEKEKEKISDIDARKITDELNNFMRYINTDIRFTLHEKLNQLIVQVIDTKDNTVLKQFPPQELLDTMANIRELIGVFLDKKA